MRPIYGKVKRNGPHVKYIANNLARETFPVGKSKKTTRGTFLMIYSKLKKFCFKLGRKPT